MEIPSAILLRLERVDLDALLLGNDGFVVVETDGSEDVGGSAVVEGGFVVTREPDSVKGRMTPTAITISA